MSDSDDVFKHALRRLVGRNTAKEIVSNLQTGQRSHSPEEVRAWIRLANALLAGEEISADEHLLFAVFRVEGIHEKRWLDGEYPELKIISNRMRQIERDAGLSEDQYWIRKDAPPEYQELADKYDTEMDARLVDTLKEFELIMYADLMKSDPSEYHRRRERGRRAVFEKDDSKKSVSASVNSFEDEAARCAGAGAFYAACIMLGSATEARLLDACLARSADLLIAIGSLPKAKQPRQNNPLYWSLDDLINVTESAGWVGQIENDEIVINVAAWLDDLRETRNLLHPGRHARKRPHVAIGEEDYADAILAYRALCLTLDQNFLASKIAELRQQSDIDPT